MSKIKEIEWAEAEHASEIFGVPSNTLLKRALSGDIKSVVVKASPDARRGTRIYSMQSIREFLEKEATQ